MALALLMAVPAMAQRKRGPEESQQLTGLSRIREVVKLISQDYVENPDLDKASEKAVVAMLAELDPHSVYIPARDVERANEGLRGNFEGVGISFQIVKDTVVVVEVIVGGPAEKVGMERGDKLLTVNGVAATGDTISNAWVPRYLRGKKGTKVEIEVLRGGRKLKFDVVRDNVPLYSVDTYFMADDSIGYICLSRFARTSVDEVRDAIKKLKAQGMTSLMLDLRGNGGGYLDIACGLANEFLSNRSLIVYTAGRNSPRQNFKANFLGSFRKGGLVVLIDEGSASASEIVSGAIQDWDRGVIVGRRSFGKGLVQRMYGLEDGAQVRLTTARYYTPSGRCIQRPYDKGSDAYRNDINQRYKHGEMVSADSIRFADSLKYKTNKGRIVYGGGGIMPDVFVPMDTMRLSQFFIDLRSKGIINEWTSEWASKHREEYRGRGFEDYLAGYDELGLVEQLEAYALEKGVVRDVEAEAKEAERVRHSDTYMHELIKALVAKDLFGREYYYRVMKDSDDCFKEGMRQLRMMNSQESVLSRIQVK